MNKSELKEMINETVKIALNDIRNINEKNVTTSNNQAIFEMARIGFICQRPVLEIYIHTDDPGNIPHFHIRDYKKSGQSGQEFHTCVQFKSNTYFHHTGKEDYLNSDQRKELVQFLSQNYRGRNGYTNWQKLVDDWNDNNSSIQLDEDTPMPNYRTINDN